MKPHESLSEGRIRLLIDSIAGWQESAECNERMERYEYERGDMHAAQVQRRKAETSRAVALCLLFELYDSKHRCACCCFADPQVRHLPDRRFAERAQVRWNEILEMEDKEVDARAFLLKTLHAPWTEEQVDALNRYQTEGCMHPFTGEAGPGGEERVLIATKEGWTETPGGPVVQTWAWRWMAGVPEGEISPFAVADEGEKSERSNP